VGKVVVSACARRAPTPMARDLRSAPWRSGGYPADAQQVARRIAVHAGLEVAAVVPVRRIPKTTAARCSPPARGGYLGDSMMQISPPLRALAGQQGVRLDGGSAIEAQLQQICDSALEGRRFGPHDSLFDIGRELTQADGHP